MACKASGRARADARKGLLAVSYGSALPGANDRCLAPVIRALEECVPAGCAVAEAYTSAKARAAVPGSLDVDEALRALLAQGVQDLAVGVTHLVDGISYAQVTGAVRVHLDEFSSVRLARPLLDGPRDAETLAEALDRRYPAREGTAVVLVGHGTEGAGQAAYGMLEGTLSRRGRTDMLVGVMHGEPGYDEVEARLRAMGDGLHPVRSVLVAPILLVAGGHVFREVLGKGPGSWMSRLAAAGYQVEPCGDGLGEMPEMAGLACCHLREAAPLA